MLLYRGDGATQKNECWRFPTRVGIYRRWPWCEKGLNCFQTPSNFKGNFPEERLHCRSVCIKNSAALKHFACEVPFSGSYLGITFLHLIQFPGCKSVPFPATDGLIQIATTTNCPRSQKHRIGKRTSTLQPDSKK